MNDLRQLRGDAPARNEDGARGRPRGLVLRTFARTYAFPTKFHGDSIAYFRCLWLVVKCQNRSTCFDVRVLDMPLLDATMACSPCSSPTQRYRIREISVRTAARLCGMSPIRLLTEEQVSALIRHQINSRERLSREFPPRGREPYLRSRRMADADRKSCSACADSRTPVPTAHVRAA